MCHPFVRLMVLGLRILGLLSLLCSLGKEQVVMKTDKGFGPLVISEVLYNLKHGTSKVIVIDGDSNDFSIEMSFVESLVSPPRSNEKGRC